MGKCLLLASAQCRAGKLRVELKARFGGTSMERLLRLSAWPALIVAKSKAVKLSVRSLGTLLLAALITAGLLLLPGEGRAQSAVDGFDPGANNSIPAVAVQADGKILLGGFFTTLGGGGFGVT